MHADELRSAVTKVVDILNEAEIRIIVDQYRSSRGDRRTVAAARLGHAGALIMEQFQDLPEAEKRVVKCLHLEALGAADYWQSLLGDVEDPRKHQAEIVRLASRVMFATSHLPGLIKLLSSTAIAGQSVADNTGTALHPGEGGLHIRLTDAGEKAADPDRIARSIDGIDMLYSACASIARKPAMDLRLDRLSSRRNQDRELQFSGERDAVAAVYAVIDSIPAVLAEMDPEQDIDLDAVVRSLPIFEDLDTLATLGTFSRKDLKDISDTMHQGALLTLESGVILVDQAVPAPAEANQATVDNQQSVQSHHSLTGDRVATSEVSESSAQSASPVTTRDEHYERYLREREAMLRPSAAESDINGHIPLAPGEALPQPTDGAADDRLRRDAVDQLLKSLEQSRRS